MSQLSVQLPPLCGAFIISFFFWVSLSLLIPFMILFAFFLSSSIILMAFSLMSSLTLFHLVCGFFPLLLISVISCMLLHRHPLIMYCCTQLSKDLSIFSDMS